MALSAGVLFGCAGPSIRVRHLDARAPRVSVSVDDRELGSVHLGEAQSWRVERGERRVSITHVKRGATLVLVDARWMVESSLEIVLVTTETTP